MPFSDYAIDNFISPNFSQLTECNAADLAARFPNAENWFASFILNSTFGHRIGEPGRKFGYLFLRRAEAAFINYSLARTALEEFTLSEKAGDRKLLSYFRALHFFEATLAVWQAFKIYSRIAKQEPYQKGDGSNYEKLNDLYNLSRHTDPASFGPQQWHVIWITNDGLASGNVSLPFSALEQLMVEVGDLATYIASCEWHQPQSENESGEGADVHP
jgi:hypothetical protein